MSVKSNENQFECDYSTVVWNQWSFLEDLSFWKRDVNFLFFSLQTFLFSYFSLWIQLKYASEKKYADQHNQ